MTKKINTVIFDIGGVLVDYHQEEYYRRRGYAPETAARLAAVTMRSSWWDEYDRGLLSDEEIRGCFKKNAPELAEEIDASLTHMAGIVTKRETAIPWIRSVKARGCRALVLSNFSHTAYEDCREDAMQFLDETDGGILSFREHVIKPEPLIYELLLGRYAIDPARAVFIDDTQKNLTGAERFGIRTIHYRSQEQAESELDALLGR
ncbi:HAD family hydrolase [Lachnoclostridium sp. Marseille-P6806]|uniref:HAD family hydrolase n=1 Tax=Lachnoclostridium sp. Marseille-P6806 TaxID=2364793 RepID=UPI001031DBD2|nr:HAD family phosphatase [Lachnoclostridium sp. Marseille-P6806]